MSAKSRFSLDTKALLHELKTNRKTQAVALLAPLTLAFLVYSLLDDGPKARPRTARTFAAPISGQTNAAIQKLPDLAQLNKAGELPGEGRMYRDLILFDMPAPPPPPKPKPAPLPPPPPPPTKEQIAAEQLRQARQNEQNLRPQSLRYLGYMGTATSGRLGAFMKGDDSVSIRLGDLANPHWRLSKLTENYAEFQNVKFQDLLFRLEAGDARSTNATAAPSNEF
ncbi:MAG TPA: hypothetical protein PKL14_00885 [Holophaga sp.]|jgi:type IV secretory pathway VirB10-like protein|nr:hypothetical protein [Holophaga sp.]